MFYQTGCTGRVVLGKLPNETQQRLLSLPGEWLEFDPAAGAIVVRHCQPSSGPCLPAITEELVRMLAEVPGANQSAIPGGDLYVHTEGKGQLVRLQVVPGGVLRICWAHPDYSGAHRAQYTGREALVEPQVQRLNGCVSLVVAEPLRAAQELEALANDFEGLYPEGEVIASTDERESKVQLELREVNLDVRLLIARLQQLAAHGALFGRIEVTSFAAADPEQFARFLFDGGNVWIERPALWEGCCPEQERVTFNAA